VRDHVTSEPLVIVSSLAELETRVQVTAAWLAGRHRKARKDRFRAKLRGTDPFRFRPLPGTVFETALWQHAGAGRTHRCTLDRLHLAAHVAEVDLAVDALPEQALPEQVAPGAGLADNPRVIVPSARRFLSCAYLGA
jgi:hypothetical protein